MKLKIISLWNYVEGPQTLISYRCRINSDCLYLEWPYETMERKLTKNKAMSCALMEYKKKLRQTYLVTFPNSPVHTLHCNIILPHQVYPGTHCTSTTRSFLNIFQKNSGHLHSSHRVEDLVNIYFYSLLKCSWFSLTCTYICMILYVSIACHVTHGGIITDFIYPLSFLSSRWTNVPQPLLKKNTLTLFESDQDPVHQGHVIVARLTAWLNCLHMLNIRQQSFHRFHNWCICVGHGDNVQARMQVGSAFCQGRPWMHF